MRILTLLALIFFSFISHSCAQQKDTTMSDKATLPYYQIPEYPEEYSATSVGARMIDGLGFRYYWGTEGLRQEDLDFKPNEEARTTLETMDHILGLSNVILNGAKNQPNIRGGERESLGYEQLREKTLNNLKEASDLLRNMDESQMDSLKVIFNRQDSSSEFPFWNLINGPIADAIWHVGQVVSFRRSSGNPLNSRASMFTGKLREPKKN